MIADSIHFTGHHCFKTGWSGFDTVRPINVIIGRNNTGKSHLLDLVEAMCKAKQIGRGWRCKYSGLLDEDTLKSVFPPGQGGGDLRGRHWEDHGLHFLNQAVGWETDVSGVPKDVTFGAGFDHRSQFGKNSTDYRLAQIHNALRRVTHRLSNSQFLRLLADRDVRPEKQSKELALSPDGRGATNIVRRYLLTASLQYPREVIQVEVLNALNRVFAGDGHFTEIAVKVLDEITTDAHDWEVYLGQDKKGLVALSSSGS